MGALESSSLLIKSSPFLYSQRLLSSRTSPPSACLVVRPVVPSGRHRPAQAIGLLQCACCFFGLALLDILPKHSLVRASFLSAYLRFLFFPFLSLFFLVILVCLGIVHEIYFYLVSGFNLISHFDAPAACFPSLPPYERR